MTAHPFSKNLRHFCQICIAFTYSSRIPISVVTISHSFWCFGLLTFSFFSLSCFYVVVLPIFRLFFGFARFCAQVLFFSPFLVSMSPILISTWYCFWLDVGSIPFFYSSGLFHFNCCRAGGCAWTVDNLQNSQREGGARKNTL